MNFTQAFYALMAYAWCWSMPIALLAIFSWYEWTYNRKRKPINEMYGKPPFVWVTTTNWVELILSNVGQVSYFIVQSWPPLSDDEWSKNWKLFQDKGFTVTVHKTVNWQGWYRHQSQWKIISVSRIP